MHSVGPRTGSGYSPHDAVACHAWLTKKLRGPWPSARSSGEAAHMPAQGYAHTRRGHRTRTGAVARSPVAQWWLADAKVYPSSTNEALGWHRAMWRSAGLTREVGR
jgi:hypothetical protein